MAGRGVVRAKRLQAWQKGGLIEDAAKIFAERGMT